MAQLLAGHVPLIQRLRERLFPPASIDDALWAKAHDGCAWISALDPNRKQRLRELAARFLREKAITAVGGLVLKAQERILLAALCSLPLLEIGARGWRGWSELVVYPGAFRVQRHTLDADGVLHEWEDELIGEAWGSGPMIVSWTDVLADVREPHSGYNVVAHEMAHKIDALDGTLDGTPPLAEAWRQQWARDFQHHFDQFRRRVETGRHTRLDPYAAESAEEFFAVMSECHFSMPVLLRKEMPEIAAHLRRLYGPPPFDR